MARETQVQSGTDKTSSITCKMKMWGPLFKNSEFQEGDSRALNQAAGTEVSLG